VWSSGQDQTAVIKRQLQLLLPGIHAFLDVDDLEEIGQLEEYVGQSEVILMFLSKGYFLSTNCLREIDATITQGKPIVGVHEADLARGGLPLAELRSDLEMKERPQAAEVIFDETAIIRWHRVHEFQLQSLKMISEELLLKLPDSSNQVTAHAKGKGEHFLFMPGEISAKPLVFVTPITLFASPDNPGAFAFGEELVEHHFLQAEANAKGRRKTVNRQSQSATQQPLLQLTALSPEATRNRGSGKATLGGLVRSTSIRSGVLNAFGALDKNARETSEGEPAAGADAVHVSVDPLSPPGTPGTPPPSPATHMLLYLNHETFIGAGRDALVRQVTWARRTNMPLCMVHENDPERGGCTFDRFFQTTPQSLIDGGLYRKIAPALHAGKHRAISMALVAKELGGVDARTQSSSRISGRWLVKRKERLSCADTSGGAEPRRLSSMARAARRVSQALACRRNSASSAAAVAGDGPEYPPMDAQVAACSSSSLPSTRSSAARVSMPPPPAGAEREGGNGEGRV